MSNYKIKADAVLEAIRQGDVGGNIVILNNDKSVWCVLKLICREHKEDKKARGEKWQRKK